jgi:hypothetical protein
MAKGMDEVLDEETDAIVPLESTAMLDVLPSPGVVTARAAADQLAAQVSAIMDRIAERMALESPHPSTARKVRGARTVPREFVVGLTALVEWMPMLSGTFDTAAAHGVLESLDAHKQLAERTALLLASMKYTNEARWAKVVSAAMYTFAIASSMATDPKNGELAARVESLSHLLGRRGTKKNKKDGSGK